MLQDVIENIMFSLTKAIGIAQIFDRLHRNGLEELALPLGNIMNLSLKLSTFPEDCKLAELKPILKRYAMTDPKNYQPISLLLLLSKILLS